MTAKEFLEKLKKNIDANADSFVENMRSEGVSELDYCDWFDWFFAWMECATIEECNTSYDELGDVA